MKAVWALQIACILSTRRDSDFAKGYSDAAGTLGGSDPSGANQIVFVLQDRWNKIVNILIFPELGRRTKLLGTMWCVYLGLHASEALSIPTQRSGLASAICCDLHGQLRAGSWKDIFPQWVIYTGVLGVDRTRSEAPRCRLGAEVMMSTQLSRKAFLLHAQ